MNFIEFGNNAYNNRLINLENVSCIAYTKNTDNLYTILIDSIKDSSYWSETGLTKHQFEARWEFLKRKVLLTK